MLNIPSNFLKDIQGNNTNLIPLVVIDERIFLSTNSLSFNGETYDPLIKSIGNLSSSIDISENAFTISSIDIDCINAQYNNEFLSEKLFSSRVINTQVKIYWKSQSSQTLEDCLLVYTGYVKSIEENKDNLSMEVEDHTEKILDKDTLNEFVRDDISLPQRYHNLPVPLVYGVVDKAPCVYYDLYSSLLLTRNRDYALTPDSFAIQSIDNPQIFTNKAYMKIREESTLFASQAANTLYRDVIPQQYRIIGNNRILVSKSPDPVVIENFEDEKVALKATATGFNFVEVEQISNPTLIDSKYVLHYKRAGLTHKYAISDISAYDGVGTLVQGKEFGTFSDRIKIKDYGSVQGTGEFPEDLQYWFYGDNLSHNETDYEQIYGESFINFELPAFANESSVVKSLLKKSNGESKNIKSIVNLSFNADAQVRNVENQLPRLFFQWTDNSAEIWDMDDYIDTSNTGEYLIQSEALTTGDLSCNSVSANNFTIGQRTKEENEDGEFTGFSITSQKGIVDYIKINNISMKKIAILSDFTSYDIYASVRGRVDNVQGTYTGYETLRFEQTAAPVRESIDTKEVLPTGIRKPITNKLPIKPAIEPIQLIQQKPALRNVIRVKEITDKGDY